jgi:predicted Zn-dependent protease
LRGQVLRSVRLRIPGAVVRAVDELLGDTLLAGGEILPYLDVVVSRPVSEPRETLRVAAELARVGDFQRAHRLLDMLDSGQFLGVETAFWRLWVQHHLQGRSNEDALARSRELLRLRPDSLLTMALAWSVAVEAGEEDAAQALLDDIARRWPRRAATLAARSGG